MANKYSRLKIFHYKDKLDSLPKENPIIKAPIHIRIKPTNVCAHNCWYCAYKAENLQLGKDMVIRDYIPLDKMFEIISDSQEIGVQAITFSGGGDPFQYKYLLESVQKLSQTNIKFAALTHGANLTGELATIFSKYGSWVRISVDGWDDKSYAEYRNIKIGAFTKLLNNIKSFIALNGKCQLGIVIVIDHKNVSHIYEMVKLYHSLGVHSIKLSPCIVSNNGTETNQYHNQIWEEARIQIDKSIKDFQSDSFEIFDAYHKISSKFDKDYGWCPYLQINPVIGADQNVYTCHDKAYNLENGILGNIKETSLKEFWFKNKNNFFKINPSVDCNHHCAVHSANDMILDYLNVDTDHMDFV